MVRTKQPRKTRSIRETTDEREQMFVKDFQKQAAQRISNIEADLTLQIKSIMNTIDVALASLPMEIRKLKLGELLAYETINANDPTIETTNESLEISSMSRPIGRPKKALQRATATSDDGYATESASTARTTHVSRINETKNADKIQMKKHRSSSNDGNSVRRVTRTTRSVSRNRQNSEQENRNDLMKSKGRCPPSSLKYKTPSLKNQNFFGVVTPKIKPNTPMNVMRRPRQGEMVLSMQGSPLLVSSVVQEGTANINVPLGNGDVISLLPHPGLRLSHMPTFDDETMKQLKTLKNHLVKVMGSK